MANQNVWNEITPAELNYSKQAFERIRKIPWAKPLVTEFEANGGFSVPDKTRPFLFEIRYAADLVDRGVKATKEVDCGVHDTNIDFEVVDGVRCLIELVLINESWVISEATKTEILPGGLEMKSLTLDSRSNLSEAREMTICQQKILDKAATRDGQPKKFPDVAPNTLHLILVDSRAFCGGDGPRWEHTHQMTHGPAKFAEENQHLIKWLDQKPVEGVYVPGYPDLRAPLLQTRIHAIGFVNEKEFRVGGVIDQTTYLPNLNLLPLKDFESLFPASLSRGK
jgi:hypothetical protein